MFFTCIDQTCNQLETPGGTKSFFESGPNFLKLCPMSNTFFQEGKKICKGVAAPRLPGYKPSIYTVQRLHWNQLLQFTCHVVAGRLTHNLRGQTGNWPS